MFVMIAWLWMKSKLKKNDVEVPFDPILFAATVPARKPTAKDLADVEEHKNDPKPTMQLERSSESRL